MGCGPGQAGMGAGRYPGDVQRSPAKSHWSPHSDDTG